MFGAAAGAGRPPQNISLLSPPGKAHQKGEQGEEIAADPVPEAVEVGGPHAHGQASCFPAVPRPAYAGVAVDRRR